MTRHTSSNIAMEMGADTATVIPPSPEAAVCPSPSLLAKELEST